jgi:hypothetical protein
MLNVRVDDFLLTKDDESWRHNLENFKLFDAVMAKYGVNYVLGVIPRTATAGHLEYLASNPRVEVAMHGILHDERFRNEFREHQTETDIVNALSSVKQVWDSIVGPVDKYIPPHNVVDYKTCRALSTLGFSTVFGGPETDENVAEYARGLGLNFEISAAPLEYGRSDELLQRGSVPHLSREVSIRPVWLTLHWTWEFNIGLSNLDTYLKELEPALKDGR